MAIQALWIGIEDTRHSAETGHVNTVYQQKGTEQARAERNGTSQNSTGGMLLLRGVRQESDTNLGESFQRETCIFRYLCVIKGHVEGILRDCGEEQI